MEQYKCDMLQKSQDDHISKNCWLEGKSKQQHAYGNKRKGKAIDIEQFKKDFTKVWTKKNLDEIKVELGEVSISLENGTSPRCHKYICIAIFWRL